MRIRGICWRIFRATPLYYLLRHVMAPLLAHAYFGTRFFPAALGRYCLYVVILLGVAAMATPQAIDAILLQQIREASQQAEANEDAMRELTERVDGHAEQLRGLHDITILLPGIRDAIKDTQGDVRWIMRGAIGQLVVLLLMTVSYSWRRWHMKRPAQ